MPKENKSQYAILGFLSRQDMSGYDLLKRFDRISTFYWSEKNAQVYNTLKQLQKKGYVNSSLDKGSGARKRRVYHITLAGLEHLKEWLELPVAPRVYREELLLKITNGQHLPKAIIVKHLKEYQAYLEQQMHEHEEVLDHLERDHKGRKDQAYLQMVYGFVGDLLKTKLKWVKSCLAKL